MSLSPTQRVRFARHVLLSEVGVDGQAALCSARGRLEGPSAAFGNEYLERAGLRAGDARALPGIASSAPLGVALQSLVAAFEAVETIKESLGQARAPFPLADIESAFSLSDEKDR